MLSFEKERYIKGKMDSLGKFMQNSVNGINGTGLHRELNRVVITGLGAISPLGLSVEQLWDGVRNGRSGIGAITRFDASGFKAQIAGEVRDFDPRNYMERKEARRLDPFIQYALAATQEAMEDAELKMDDEDPTRVGVLLASGVGGVQTTLENEKTAATKGPSRVSPFMIPNMLIDSAAGNVSVRHGMRGVNHSVVSACASSTAAGGEAFEIIRRGDADVMLVGGSDATILPTILAGFDVMSVLCCENEEPEKASRPFDLNRSGFVMSEGCAMLVMETEAHALARNAQIYAEVIGYGNSADAYHMVAPHEQGRGASDALEMALHKASDYGVGVTDIDYINAHGTSTRLNDRGETMAIKQVLGDHAYDVHVSSTKSVTGHMLGGAGAIEAVICAKVIQDGIIPPTINLDEPDPECDLNYTPHKAVKADVNVTVSNSFGFGGHNACIMLRKYPK